MQGIRSDGGDLIPLQMAAKEKQGVRRASEILDKQAWEKMSAAALVLMCGLSHFRHAGTSSSESTGRQGSDHVVIQISETKGQVSLIFYHQAMSTLPLYKHTRNTHSWSRFLKPVSDSESMTAMLLEPRYLQTIHVRIEITYHERQPKII